MNSINIGVVGYSGQKFDEVQGRALIEQAYTQIASEFPDHQKRVVSGLTDLGIPALAYRAAVERGWETVGIACTKAVEYDCFPVDEKIIVGQNWGDESPTFLSSIDYLVRVGGGSQSLEETLAAKESEKPTLEYELAALPK